MLSSAKKSVPTTKQFIQPYFIEIAPEGAIKATCARFSALLQKREIYTVLEMNVLEVFVRLGAPDPALISGWLKERFLTSFDMPVHREGARPFHIRWTPTPIHSTGENESGWQLTGMKVNAGQALRNDPVDVRESERS